MAAEKSSGRKPRRWKKKRILGTLYITDVLILLAAVGVLIFFGIRPGAKAKQREAEVAAVLAKTKKPSPEEEQAKAEAEKAAKEAARREAARKPVKDKVPDSFQPHAVDSTQPSNLIQYTNIMVDGSILENVSDYQSPFGQISFGAGSEYTDVDGIITFRGNNYRNRPAYGLSDYKDYKLSTMWTNDTEGLTYNGNTWTGNGWTGQPLLVKWPKDVKQHMNMRDWAKEKDDLVEAIYASMDGYIYFMDIETGEKTRDDLWMGYTFKGAGALDPRGYPIMYVGSGINSNEGISRVFIVNLLDCSTMYTFGNSDEFEMRNVDFYDSSALVDAETDTLIYPGENGILYMMKLNTQYDAAAGTLSIAPSNIVKWRYWGTRTSDDSFWLGMEDSADIYEGYMFIADNGGNLMCLDLNTLQLVWVQDVLDDSNSTPVLSVEDGRLYLYVSTSFHLGWRSYDTAEIPIWKIDAETGEIVWQTSYTCSTIDGVSGGVQSTIAMGERDLSDYIYVTVSMTGDTYSGVLACIKKSSGEIVWEHNSAYAWSSPVCVYNPDDTGKVIYCASNGNMYMLDGLTGEEHCSISLSEGVIEASPAVYNNYVVVGTRDCKIYGIEIS